jgi:anaerobic magnesium-protoporphyrin IX monomethyl ester cyclase
MRVAIIAPPYPLEEAPAPPLGVTYVAAAFESAGAQVRIFDYIVSRYTEAKLRAQLDEFRPQIVGATSVTLNFVGAANIIGAAKRYRPSIITLMGGPHVSFDAAGALKGYPEIDLIIRGEGEQTIAELMEKDMDPASWSEISGLAFRRNGQPIETPPRAFIPDLDILPLPARHLLPLSRYQALGYPISIITSRGCPYSCIFCQGRRMVGNRMRQRSSTLVVDEIEQIISYGISRINVADDLFVSERGKVREVCDEILKRGLHFQWSAFARVNTVDLETLRLMRDAGCDSVSFGVESGNAEMLRRIRKGITREEVREAVSLCQETGIIAHTSFIAGLPGESPETLRETDEFAASLGSLYGYHYLVPFPGTTIREEVEQYDLEILTDDWTRYDANSAIVRTAAISSYEIERFVKEFEGEIQRVWESMVSAYRTGSCPPEVALQVEGQFRTKLIYRILSEDLLEKIGSIRLPEMGTEAFDASFDELCREIESVTEDDGTLIRKTLHSLWASGFIKADISGDGVKWYWTHNHHVAHLETVPASR